MHCCEVHYKRMWVLHMCEGHLKRGGIYVKEFVTRHVYSGGAECPMGK